MSSINTAPDEVRRFIIENQPVRGYWVDMESAWQELRAHQNYPLPVRDLLGEAVSASVLLAATLKFEGTLTLQLESKGNVRLLVAQCTHDFRVRAVARFDAEGEFAAGTTFGELVGADGRVVVTIEAAGRDMRYQGIVPLTGSSLSECLEEYFASSEQLPTRVRLAADDRRAVGLLVQKLPEHGGDEPEHESPAAIAWRDAERGIQSVQPAELVEASLQNLLVDRFGQRDLRVFKGAPVQFACRCSPSRVAGLLRTLGADEVRDVLRERGSVEVTCEFCQRPYRYDAFAVEQLFDPGSTPDASTSVH
jgi:molecular chaperone Hsp33